MELMANLKTLLLPPMSHQRLKTPKKVLSKWLSSQEAKLSYKQPKMTITLSHYKLIEQKLQNCLSLTSLVFNWQTNKELSLSCTLLRLRLNIKIKRWWRKSCLIKVKMIQINLRLYLKPTQLPLPTLPNTTSPQRICWQLSKMNFQI